MWPPLGRCWLCEWAKTDQTNSLELSAHTPRLDDHIVFPCFLCCHLFLDLIFSTDSNFPLSVSQKSKVPPSPFPLPPSFSLSLHLPWILIS